MTQPTDDPAGGGPAPDTRTQPATVAWHLVGSSPAVMDQNFCDGRFPSPWQPSLAIFAAAAPTTHCERIIWLKVAVTLTGIQVDEHAQPLFDDLRESQSLDILDDYLGCYGAMLRVGVYPTEEGVDLANFPRIVECQPRNRDLYQAATVEGEVLTGSSTDLNIDHSHKTTNSQELDAEVKGGYGSGGDGGGSGGSGGGGGAGPNIQASLTTKFNWSDERTDSTNLGLGTTGQTRTATTTTISQLYSLLEAYHVGSNVVSFLMLPRPHVLPSTLLNTFVPGLRALDGIQEFFLAVAAPMASRGLRIEARIDTGHFSVASSDSVPPPITTIGGYIDWPIRYLDEQVARSATSSDHFDLQLSVRSTGAFVGGEATHNSFVYVADVPPDDTFHLGDLVIDTSRGDPGHQGISLVADHSPSATQGRLQNNLYYAISDTSVRIEIDVTTAALQGLPDIDMLYRVYTRPRTVGDSARTDVVVVARSLCSEFENFDGDGCPVGATSHEPAPPEIHDRVIPHGHVRRSVGTGASGGMVGSYGLAMDLLNGMRQSLSGVQRKSARGDASRSLADSDLVVRQLAKTLDPRIGARKISTLKLTDAIPTLRSQTIAQVLSLPIAALARQTNEPQGRLRVIRRAVLTRALNAKQPPRRPAPKPDPRRRSRPTDELSDDE